MGRMPSIVLVATALLISACSSRNLIPDRVYQPQYEPPIMDALVAKYQNPETIAALDNVDNEKDRNKFVDELVFMVDITYENYSSALRNTKATLDTAFDVAIITLGAIGAISTQSHIQTILAASSAGAAGTRASIDKNFFNEKGIDAIISVMRASRAEIRANIRLKMTLPLSQYGMKHALSDITEYNGAGSITQALATIQQASGVKEENSKADEKKFFKDMADNMKILKLKSKVSVLVSDTTKKGAREAALIAWFQEKKEIVVTSTTIMYHIVNATLSVDELDDLISALEKTS